MPHSHGLWQRTFAKVRSRYPQNEARHLYVDTLAMMLNELGFPEESANIEKVVAAAIHQGIATPDLGANWEHVRLASEFAAAFSHALSGRVELPDCHMECFDPRYEAGQKITGSVHDSDCREVSRPHPQNAKKGPT